MSILLHPSFWALTAERAVRAFAATALGLLGGGAIDIISFDWQALASVSAGASVVSILASIVASGTTGSPESPSFLE